MKANWETGRRKPEVGNRISGIWRLASGHWSSSRPATTGCKLPNLSRTTRHRTVCYLELGSLELGIWTLGASKAVSSCPPTSSGRSFTRRGKPCANEIAPSELAHCAPELPSAQLSPSPPSRHGGMEEKAGMRRRSGLRGLLRWMFNLPGFVGRAKFLERRPWLCPAEPKTSASTPGPIPLIPQSTKISIISKIAMIAMIAMVFKFFPAPDVGSQTAKAGGRVSGVWLLPSAVPPGRSSRPATAGCGWPIATLAYLDKASERRQFTRWSSAWCLKFGSSLELGTLVAPKSDEGGWTLGVCQIDRQHIGLWSARRLRGPMPSFTVHISWRI